MDLEVIDTVFYCALSSVISVTGSVANAINIIIFFQQGFKDTTNISLFGLAVSDLLILVTLAWTSICNNPLFQKANSALDVLAIEYVTAGWPQASLFRVTSWITAFITLERCVCIALPLKVKDIITPKRTFFIIIAIFTAMFAILCPEFATVSFAPLFNTKHNNTMIGLMYSGKAMAVKDVTVSINIAAQLCSFIAVVICTSILGLNLISKSQLRQQMSSFSDSSVSMSLRDKRVMKMVTCISCIFIICYLPAAVNLILMVHLSDYRNNGRYHDIYTASWAVFSTLEALNSSISIFVYYNMSSKFRAGFHKMFGLQ